jgi:hypothetical protein
LLQPLGLSLEQMPDMQLLLQASASLLGEQFQVYARAPLILRQQLLFPYVHGLTFIKAALAQGGWGGLERVYRRPPASTEHILHPEKYFAAAPDLPSEVTLQIAADSLQGSWKKLKRDVLGEFLLSVVLQQFLPEAEARQSAAGWRGDRYEVLEHQDSGGLLLVGVTAWDTPADATEFFQSYKKLLTLKYPDWSMTSLDDHTGHVWQRGDSRLLLRRQEHLVQIIEGVQAADLPHLQVTLAQVTAVPKTPR